MEFDSLFNESRYTWAYGSEDIVPMFKLGASGSDERIFVECYSSEEQKFEKSPDWMDVWVHDKVKELLGNATVDKELDARLRSDKVIIFLQWVLFIILILF